MLDVETRNTSTLTKQCSDAGFKLKQLVAKTPAAVVMVTGHPLRVAMTHKMRNLVGKAKNGDCMLFVRITPKEVDVSNFLKPGYDYQVDFINYSLHSVGSSAAVYNG